MLELVQTPTAKALWRMCKFFHLPMSDPRIQSMDRYDIDFYEYSMIAENPEALKRLENHFFDPEWDDFVAEFEEEQRQKALQKQLEEKNNPTDNDDKPAEETPEEPEYGEEYDISEPIDSSEEWEVV